ncbi:hypothetical protein E2P81_ATG11372 [Venturia nashicola]|nr:hypothetical protein E2P81_ATG11372 [Venturia nashicola]
MSRSPLTPGTTSQAINTDDSISPTSLQTPQTPQQSDTTTMAFPRTLNPAFGGFVIVQTQEDEGQNHPNTPQPKPYDADFTFVGGIYSNLNNANTAALDLAAQKCNCNTPSLTFPPSKMPFKNNEKPTSSPPATQSPASEDKPSVPDSPLLGSIPATARPQFIQQSSEDGRYTCRCTTSSSEDGSEGKGVRFEVRKIEVKPLGSRMGWNFRD